MTSMIWLGQRSCRRAVEDGAVGCEARASGRPLRRHIEQIAPRTVGLAIQNTTNQTPPITAWAGLGVLTAWTAASLLAGALLLRLCDA